MEYMGLVFARVFAFRADVASMAIPNRGVGQVSVFIQVPWFRWAVQAPANQVEQVHAMPAWHCQTTTEERLLERESAATR